MLGRLDYRNLRWQGQLEAGTAQGVGFIMDHNRLFALAEWQEGRISGPICVIYPSRVVFCGMVRQEAIELGCFYLPDRVRVLVAAQAHKFVAVLPFCKLVLQFAKGKGKQGPAAQQHLKYNSQDQLSTIVSSTLGLSNAHGSTLAQLSSWRKFLKQRLADEHAKHIQYWEKQKIYYTQVLVGTRCQGLGIKLLEFNEQYSGRVDCAPSVVEQMGVFGSRGRLQSLALRAVPNTNYQQYQEGELTAESYQTVEYGYGRRPTACNSQFIKWLKISYDFTNQLMNISWLYSLEQQYCSIDVKMVQETQKVAQIVLRNNKEGQSVVVAQIADDKDKRITPVTSGVRISSARQEEAKIVVEQKKTDIQRRSNRSLGRQEYNSQAVKQLLNRLQTQVSRRNDTKSNHRQDSKKSLNRKLESHRSKGFNDDVLRLHQEAGKSNQPRSKDRRKDSSPVARNTPPKPAGTIMTKKPRSKAKQTQPSVITDPSELNWPTADQQYQSITYHPNRSRSGDKAQKKVEQEEDVVAFFNTKLQQSIGQIWEQQESAQSQNQTQLSSSKKLLGQLSLSSGKKAGQIRGRSRKRSDNNH